MVSTSEVFVTTLNNNEINDFDESDEESEEESDDDTSLTEDNRSEGIAEWRGLTKDLVAPMDHTITEQSLIGLKQYMSEQHARFLLHMIDKEAKRRALIHEHPPYLGSFAHVYDDILELTGIYPVGNVYLSVNQHAWTGHLNKMYNKYCE